MTLLLHETGEEKKSQSDVIIMKGGMVVQWLSLLPLSEKVLDPNLGADWGISVWSLHAFLVTDYVSSGYSGFLPEQSRFG